MKTFSGRATRLAGASAIAVAASLAFAGMATAQGTSTLRGQVTEGVEAEAGATVVARDVASGFTTTVRTSASGSYVLSGIRPGTYEVTVTTTDGQTASQTVTIGVGQVGTLDLVVGGAMTSVDAGATTVEEIIVRASPLFEVRTSEVGTNVTRQQIENLPQINRNFLNFAALAPGVRVTEGETERTISAGGQTAQAINVFIDGQNQKSTIIDGGVAGQDDSRGNPFPQAAVQEFRVISQNFKAEYEQAGSAIITAVTRSGTNDFTGEIFATYQNQDWIEQDELSQRRGAVQPDLTREQYGIALGGPILRDRLHYFVSYERKDEGRNADVSVNRSEYASLFADQIGNFGTPFEQDLLFGKLSWQIDDRQIVELSGTWREEADIRNVGGVNSFDRANQINTETNSIVLKHTYNGDRFVNEFSVDYFRYLYNPTALNFTDYGREFVIFRDASGGPNGQPGFQFDVFSRETTVFNTGGRSDNQNIEQESLTLENTLTLLDIEWNGRHTIKIGGKYSMQSYYVNKQFGRNPQFLFDIEGRPEITGSRDIPVRVTLGSPQDPTDAENNVIGLFIQDDWQITDRLELNLGLRWDYEDNAVNNDYVTPQRIRDMLAAIQALPNYDFPSYFNPADYISDGDRDAFTGAFQPRIGFSYDIFGDESTVLFGGAGRYYDRLGFNFAFDERFKPTQFIREAFFSVNGGLVGGRQTIAWDPRYLTPEGLDPLLASIPGAGEVFLVKNEQEPPVTDQFNLGVRQRLGDWQTAVTLSYASTENLSAWYIANPRTATGDRFSGPTPTSVGFPEFRNLIFFQNQDKELEYKALYFTADKPFTRESNWGANIAWTWSEARQNGSRDSGFAAFDFDYNVPGLSPEYPTPTDEEHRIVASGMVGLPGDFMLSGIVTLGTGLPFNVFNCPTASNPNICWNGGRPPKENFIIPNAFAFRQVDLRLTKNFETFEGHALQLIFDAINVFDFKNYSSFEGNFNNPRFGTQPFSQFLPTRSFQVGLRYSW